MTGSFEKAFIKRYDLPEDSIITIEIRGGGEVQIGDMTWDTEEASIEVTASAVQDYAWPTTVFKKDYDSLPDIWDDLIPKED